MMWIKIQLSQAEKRFWGSARFSKTRNLILHVCKEKLRRRIERESWTAWIVRVLDRMRRIGNKNNDKGGPISEYQDCREARGIIHKQHKCRKTTFDFSKKLSRKIWLERSGYWDSG